MNPITLTELRDPVIHKGLTPRLNHPHQFSKIDWLCNIADHMEVGDAVELRLTESNVMRAILAAKGFKCISDGWSCKTRGMILVFKLNKED